MKLAEIMQKWQRDECNSVHLYLNNARMLYSDFEGALHKTLRDQIRDANYEWKPKKQSRMADFWLSMFASLAATASLALLIGVIWLVTQKGAMLNDLLKSIFSSI